MNENKCLNCHTIDRIVNDNGIQHCESCMSYFIDEKLRNEFAKLGWQYQSTTNYHIFTKSIAGKVDYYRIQIHAYQYTFESFYGSMSERSPFVIDIKLFNLINEFMTYIQNAKANHNKAIYHKIGHYQDHLRQQLIDKLYAIRMDFKNVYNGGFSELVKLALDLDEHDIVRELKNWEEQFFYDGRAARDFPYNYEHLSEIWGLEINKGDYK